MGLVWAQCKFDNVQVEGRGRDGKTNINLVVVVVGKHQKC